MSSRNTRRLVSVVIVLGLMALFGLWIDKPSRDEAPSRGSPTHIREQASAPNPNGVDPAVADHAAISRDATSRTKTEEHVTVDRMQLHVLAPVDVKVGDVFEAQIDFAANGGVREIMFLLSYDQFHLALVGWSKGYFAEQGGVPAEFGAEEPSDGNIQFSLKASNGLFFVGAGTLAILQFKAIKPGMSRITPQNLAVTDRNENTDPNSVRVDDASVSIHP